MIRRARAACCCFTQRINMYVVDLSCIWRFKNDGLAHAHKTRRHTHTPRPSSWRTYKLNIHTHTNEPRHYSHTHTQIHLPTIRVCLLLMYDRAVQTAVTNIASPHRIQTYTHCTHSFAVWLVSPYAQSTRRVRMEPPSPTHSIATLNISICEAYVIYKS